MHEVARRGCLISDLGDDAVATWLRVRDVGVQPEDGALIGTGHETRGTTDLDVAADARIDRSVLIFDPDLEMVTLVRLIPGDQDGNRDPELAGGVPILTWDLGTLLVHPAPAGQVQQTIDRFDMVRDDDELNLGHGAGEPTARGTVAFKPDFRGAEG